MSLKQEIETWVAALEHYDKNEFLEAYNMFDPIMDTSKILFNCAVIQATIGEHERAVELYRKAIYLDQYLAVAYFQQGVSNFLIGDFQEALANFNDTLLYLRGNNVIDYSQLGLNFQLYSCEALFNRGLCYICMGDKGAGMNDLSYAAKEKVIADHDVIDDAITEEAEGYTVFSIPVGVVYRPNQSKVKNLKTKDYLGKARLIAASDRSNAFTGFAGTVIRNANQVGVKDDRPLENVSFAATNLVKPGLSSKTEGKDTKNVFPPTPPPESEKRASSVGSIGSRGRAASFRNGPKPKLSKLVTERRRLSIENDEQSPYQSVRTRSSIDSRSSRYQTSSVTSYERPDRSFSRGSVPRDDTYPDDKYDAQFNRPSRQNGSQRVSRQTLDEYENDSDYEGDFIDENEFEMIPVKGPRRSNTINNSLARRPSRRPEVHKIRIKVHHEEARYIMVDTSVEYLELVTRIQDKFGLQNRFKIKVREDDTPNGDMITMGDQDDLDMIIMAAKSTAKKENADVGKMEIWINLT